MRRLSLQQQRTLVIGFGSLFLLVSFIWWLSPGLPVIWGPSARASEISAGRVLFEHEWTANDPLAHGDGLGPVYNARSCAACHFQGGLGGGGEAMHNAVAFEVHSRPGDEQFHTGTIHNFSVDPAKQESFKAVRKLFPIIPGRRGGDPHCPTVVPDFDPLHTESVNATALFGAGWIDLISDKAIRKNQRDRQFSSIGKELRLQFTTIPTGRLPMTADNDLGKFGWKGQSASLSDFVAAACANELGLGTSNAKQATPINAVQADVAPDLDKKQFRSLVAFVKTLPRPVEIPPTDANQRAIAEHGKKLFKSVGCAVCHVPDMGGVTGVYSDFLLYSLDDPPAIGGGVDGGSYGNGPPRQLNLPSRPESLPKPEEWKTPPLWGVADSAPYFHDGTSPTLGSAIARHRGDAKTVTMAYEALSLVDQTAIVTFLKTLRAPADAIALTNPSVTRLKR